MSSIASTSRRTSTTFAAGHASRSSLIVSPRTPTLAPTLSSARSSSTASPRPPLELTLALIKPSVCTYQPDVSAILRLIKTSGLSIARSRRLFWTSTDAHAFYAEHRGRFYYDRLILGMISGPSLALALCGPGAVKEWRSMLGPTKAYKGKYTDDGCLRARYGLGDTRNGFHGSDGAESARRELGLVFDGWDAEWWLQREMGQLPTDQDGKVNPLGF